MRLVATLALLAAAAVAPASAGADRAGGGDVVAVGTASRPPPTTDDRATVGALVEERMRLEGRVLFKTDRARVRRRSLPVLREIAAWWRAHPGAGYLVIEGHADRRGDSRYNRWLSEERARRVAAALVELGVPEDAIELRGRGTSQAGADGDGDGALAVDRRVDFAVHRR